MPAGRLHRLLKALPLLIGTALCSSPSSAFDLNGIWATDPELCGKMFEKRGSEIAFTPLSDLYGSGFVVEGTRIKGKMAQCTIRSQKQDGETLQVAAVCATEIMHSDMQFNLKIVSETQLSGNVGNGSDLLSLHPVNEGAASAHTPSQPERARGRRRENPLILRRAACAVRHQRAVKSR
jgi:hypothetical protein